MDRHKFHSTAATKAQSSQNSLLPFSLGATASGLAQGSDAVLHGRLQRLYFIVTRPYEEEYTS
jgi:hypothetical protein